MKAKQLLNAMLEKAKSPLGILALGATTTVAPLAIHHGVVSHEKTGICLGRLLTTGLEKTGSRL